MPSVAITYDCPACHASCAATVQGLDDPTASIAPRTQDTLRRTREVLVRAGRAREGDPVDEVAAEILQQTARSTLVYAICPRCGARNPAGVAERRRWRWITAAILVALAGGAWLVRWVALLLPALDLLFFRPLAIVHARRTGLPVRWLTLAAGVAIDLALVAVVVLLPRAAPLVLLVPAALSVVRPTDDGRWADAAETIRFEE